MERGQASRGGGVAIAALTVAGAFIGARQGEPSLGFLIGFGAGVAIALALWLVDLRR